VSGYNIADLVYQLLCLLFLILIIVGTVSLFRSIKHRKTRLDIMEKKMDDLHELIKRGKNWRRHRAGVQAAGKLEEKRVCLQFFYFRNNI